MTDAAIENDDVLVIARKRAFWETDLCRRTFPHIIYLPAHTNRIAYLWYFVRLLVAVAARRPRVVVLGTTMPLAPWCARLRQAGFLRNLALITDHQFLTSAEVRQFDAVWAYSQEEFSRYDEAVRDRLVFFHYPSRTALMAVTPRSGDYVISTGNHYRDHGSFLQAMEGLTDARGIVVTANRLTVSVPGNVEARGQMPQQEYYSLMGSARFVVVPLAKSNLPHGHGDISGALSLGKAVITTRDASAGEYVKDGVNGLLVAPGDVAGYRAAIEKLWSDDALRQRIETGARASAHVFTYEHFASELSALCRRISLRR